MSMWYELAEVSILKCSVWPTLTLIDVAKPWIAASPAPLTCQSPGASPGNVFSQAMTLVIGGPHGSAPAGRALATESTLISTVSTKAMIRRRPAGHWEKSPVTDMPAPHGRNVPLYIPFTY